MLTFSEGWVPSRVKHPQQRRRPGIDWLLSESDGCSMAWEHSIDLQERPFILPILLRTEIPIGR